METACDKLRIKFFRMETFYILEKCNSFLAKGLNMIITLLSFLIVFLTNATDLSHGFGKFLVISLGLFFCFSILKIIYDNARDYFQDGIQEIFFKQGHLFQKLGEAMIFLVVPIGFLLALVACYAMISGKYF